MDLILQTQQRHGFKVTGIDLYMHDLNSSELRLLDKVLALGVEKLHAHYLKTQASVDKLAAIVSKHPSLTFVSLSREGQFDTSGFPDTVQVGLY